ncbi:hypothetical protein SAMN05216210_1620 [Halopseudomonas salegens]|uniref:Uncharacterized protein n=1 Tax=Halopseudomonas salegens TaxID=1434072 RepID=A0A1H2FK30_9GAMM|nr:hypothetical protein SAMN05216210_1620 [Halopseudomonas salegens]
MIQVRLVMWGELGAVFFGSAELHSASAAKQCRVVSGEPLTLAALAGGFAEYNSAFLGPCGLFWGGWFLGAPSCTRQALRSSAGLLSGGALTPAALADGFVEYNSAFPGLCAARGGEVLAWGQRLCKVSISTRTLVRLSWYSASARESATMPPPPQT